MKTRREIVQNWLPRYTGVPLKRFGDYILLTNFQRYVKLFAQWHHVPVEGRDKPMPSATAGRITIINFGMGSATAATIMDLLIARSPKGVLYLGKCGGLKHRAKLGSLILPIAAIRGEGTSNDYFPPEVPALPAADIAGGASPEPSRSVRERVVAARARQAERTGDARMTNAALPPARLRSTAALQPEAAALLARAMDRLALSARGHQRVVRVARTIADLEGAVATSPAHVAEALRYRPAASGGSP